MGRPIGKEALAGVGIAGNLTFIVLAVSQMLAVGATTLISQAVGRKDRDEAELVFNESLVLSVLIGALFFLTALALRRTYVSTLSADAATAARATEYLAWFIPAMSLQFWMVTMGAALRGTGNFKPGMVVQTATVIINILLAPALMFGWIGGRGLGVAGTAIASLVAVVVGTIWLATYFLAETSYLKFKRADWKPQIELWSHVLRIGLPAGAEFALIAVYLFIVYTVSRPFGAAAQAGFGIGLRIVQAGFMPVVALGFAVAPVAGQNFGARAAARVRETFRHAALLAAVAMAVFTAACHLVPAAMIRLFSSDPHVIGVGSEYLRIVSWTFVASGVIFVNASMFQAMGNTIPPLIASCARLVLVGVPVFAVSHLPGFDLRWIWYLSVAATAAQLLMNLLLLRREFRARLSFA